MLKKYIPNLQKVTWRRDHTFEMKIPTDKMKPEIFREDVFLLDPNNKFILVKRDEWELNIQ